uniref:Major facilitator superfamily (MFS) profile domain-containing protein n=1 Tax=Panagrolaimus superbus TaxID=310955 RepID=A0A914YGH3_9BILA
MFIAAPFLGKYMHVIGAKRMFSFGIFFTGITAIAFGFLNLLPPGRTFFWASLGIRCAEALGDAAFVTSSFVISAKCFPGRIATIVGIMETFAGLGYTAGPVIGGVLYV